MDFAKLTERSEFDNRARASPLEQQQATPRCWPVPRRQGLELTLMYSLGTLVTRMRSFFQSALAHESLPDAETAWAPPFFFRKLRTRTNTSAWFQFSVLSVR